METFLEHAILTLAASSPVWITLVAELTWR
jgi:hypothetical protein